MWSYRQQAFRWKGEIIAGLNLLPIATELRAWMLRKGPLSLMPRTDGAANGGFTNPYTTSGTTLALLMSKIINACHDFATSSNPSLDQIDAEIERVRLYNEVLLYSARLCEVLIKQLLYCTQIPESRYKRMALGQLLESPCPDCKRKNGQEPHLVSLVGTLAHPYQLCLVFEHCAMDHMNIVNKLRNSQAAHSEIQTLNPTDVGNSKEQLMVDSNEVLNAFLHMLSHLEDLEQEILADLIEKGNSINRLKAGGLPANECNFNLAPGEKFVFLPTDRMSNQLAFAQGSRTDA